MAEYLTESALLAHGLISAGRKQLEEEWPSDNKTIVWLEGGRIRVGGMEDFLPFREMAAGFPRISGNRVAGAMKECISGVFTASGTMEVCRLLGVPLAVSCGIGGMIPGKEAEKSADLNALANLPVSLLATAFKDMFDAGGSIAWLLKNGVKVSLVNSGTLADRKECEGYLFSGAALPELETFTGSIRSEGRELILNPIPAARRLADRSLLEKGIEAGLIAEKEGRVFHPAVNAAFDSLTDGYSSLIQLQSLAANARYASGLKGPRAAI